MGGHRFHSYEEEEMNVCEWLRMQEPCIYSGAVCKHVARRDECVNVLKDYWKLMTVEKGRDSSFGVATR